MKLVLRRRYLEYFYQVPRRSVVQVLSTIMSPSRKSLKTVALPIAKLGFTNVSRIDQGSYRGWYRGWLEALLQSKPNHKLFLKHDKNAIDQCFREQAMQQYAHDKTQLNKALDDVRKQAHTPSFPH